MAYYLLSVWKKNGEKSNSLCCSTSQILSDMESNMQLYEIDNNEVFVVSVVQNGNSLNQGGQVLHNIYYDSKRTILPKNNVADDAIISALNVILEEQNKLLKENDSDNDISYQIMEEVKEILFDDRDYSNTFTFSDWCGDGHSFIVADETCQKYRITVTKE